MLILTLFNACTPSRPSEATATVTATKTLHQPPAAVDLGVFGKGSAVSMARSLDGEMLAVGSSAGGYIYNATSWELIACIPTEWLENNGLSRLTELNPPQASS